MPRSLQAAESLRALEAWVERQATGLDMASPMEPFQSSPDKLLKARSSECS